MQGLLNYTAISGGSVAVLVLDQHWNCVSEQGDTPVTA